MSEVNCTELVNPTLITFCENTQAQLAQSTADTNNFFIIWASSLVLFMHAGFAMLSVGAIRSKNSKNILLSIVMDLTVCVLGWYLIGFAFAFGADQGGFIGSSFWVGIEVGSSPTGTYSFYFWLFQFCFAATAATIVSGAVAERCKFETYLVTSAFMSCWVYPIVVHWVWGGGFLSLGNPNGLSVMSSGVVDFAGCGPVHMVGGLAGAIASKIMGPRIGRFDTETGKPLPIPGHSSPLATLGVFILWVGWIGFNCGSVINLGGGNGQVAARAGVMTALSSGLGALSAMLVGHLVSTTEKEFDLGMGLNGALAGLVSITGCCAYVEMWAAVSIGLIGGIVYVFSSHFTLHRLKIDDPLDATPVHLFCGMWGIVAGAFFANPVLLAPLFVPPEGGSIEVPSGVFYGGNTYITKFSDGTSVPGGTILGALVANAVVEIVCVFTWVVVFTVPFFTAWQYAGLLRIDADVEAVGMDVSHHGGNAYPELFHGYDFGDESEKQKLKPKPAEAVPPAGPEEVAVNEESPSPPANAEKPENSAVNVV